MNFLSCYFVRPEVIRYLKILAKFDFKTSDLINHNYQLPTTSSKIGSTVYIVQCNFILSSFNNCISYECREKTCRKSFGVVVSDSVFITHSTINYFRIYTYGRPTCYSRVRHCIGTVILFLRSTPKLLK